MTRTRDLRPIFSITEMAPLTRPVVLVFQGEAVAIDFRDGADRSSTSQDS